jgi:hypothetical protein
MAKVSVSNKQNIQKYQKEKTLVFHPHNFHALKYLPYKIFRISHASFIFINFLTLPASERVFRVCPKINGT